MEGGEKSGEEDPEIDAFWIRMKRQIWGFFAKVKEKKGGPKGRER